MKRITNFFFNRWHRMVLVFGAGTLLASVALAPKVVKATVPKLINFQGILKNGSGQPVVDATYSVTFKIYDMPSGGNVLWMETRSVTTSSGLFTVLLGSTNPVPDSAFQDTTRYLGVKVGADPEMTPRQQLVSLSYAYRVSSVDAASGGTITSKVSIGPGHTNTGADAFVTGANNTSSGDSSAVGGGTRNTASGTSSTVGGGFSNLASREYAIVGGGQLDTASGLGSVVSGGSANVATSEHGAVGGGYGNRASGPFNATVGGGSFNTASGDHATVGGGDGNTASGLRAMVGCGYYNTSSASDATIGGGFRNTASGPGATVGGGGFNTASGFDATVGGGDSHVASGNFATVAGGWRDTANAIYATVGGGWSNNANDSAATVSGGRNNRAQGRYSIIGGGQNDTASGSYATVPGGNANKASGGYSFAAGRRAKALHDGAFVWGDNTDADFASTATNQFLIRAAGGVGIGINVPTARLQVGSVGAEGTPPFIAGTMIAAQATNADNWAHMAIISGSLGQSRLNFGDAFNDDQGSVSYDNSTDAMFFSTAAAERMRITSAGNVGIGTTTPQGALDVSSTTGAFIVPRMTTAQRNTLTAVNGMIIYNTDAVAGGRFEFRENGAWVTK